MAPAPGNAPRPQPSRFGSLFTILLVLAMVLLIVNYFNYDAASAEARNFQNLRRLAYEGDVETIKFVGDTRVEAKVHRSGVTEAETWDVPVPEYAKSQLPDLEQLVARDVHPVTLADLQGMLSGGKRLISGYTLNEPAPGLTGLYVELMDGGQSRWFKILGERGDPAITAFLQEHSGEAPAGQASPGGLVVIKPAPVGDPGRVTYEPATDIWSSLLLTFVPWLLIMIGFFWFFTRQMRAAGGSGGIMSFGRSRVKMITPDQAKVTFDLVAGVEEAKEEVQEIIAFLKDPKRFSRLGGRVPRGVLLVGPPGTGKTLLAKAIAGEANVPFFAISGSDFVEMFVGVGASRVRDLFKQARESAPCVIFLDEIDAVGRKRGAGLGGGHDEREQTLNAILVEMDGFETDSGVIMIAATNRPDVLDPALLRPGRFDRQIVLDLPDVRGREAILVVHAQKVKLAPTVDLSVVARGTPMFSGAELEALINEAALIATLKNKDAIEQDDLDEARDKVRFGRQKKSRVMVEEDRKVTAYHEAGHAIVASALGNLVEPVHKVTIIPRGMALGATMQLPERDKYHHRKSELRAMLIVLFGGRVAEELFCDDISGGAANDIERATEIARAMICSWGMSDALGPVALGERRGEVFLGDELLRSKNYSEATAEAIDREVRALLDSCHDEAKRLLTQHRAEAEQLALALLKHETVSGDEVRAIIGGAKLADLRRDPVPPRTPAPEPPIAIPSKPQVARPGKPEEGLAGDGLPVPGPA
ncbi:MAG TPA: ATP-dependent zinc metalloprotease FtsH [Planctomycetota bacterium]|nr:ATP-dependent zinc metalloprotease FtsH [Planctomycetota bacterium]